MSPRSNACSSSLQMAGLAAALLLLPGAASAPPAASTAARLEAATVVFEQNATDGDVEVVFEAKGIQEGLVKLTVTAPNGHKVVDFVSREPGAIGMRQFRFESPEPKDVNSLKVAFPEGDYAFSGTSSSGAALQGRATLRHTLPPTAAFVRPAADAENVALKGVSLGWTPVKGAAGYEVYVEQERLGTSVTARLPGSSSSFSVPDGFLAPGTEYTMGIGTIASNGNASYVEASFKTVAK